MSDCRAGLEMRRTMQQSIFSRPLIDFLSGSDAPGVNEREVRLLFAPLSSV